MNKFVRERPINPPDIPEPEVCRDCDAEECDFWNCEKLKASEKEREEEHKIQKQIEAEEEELERNAQLCMEAYGLSYKEARAWAEDEDATNL